MSLRSIASTSTRSLPKMRFAATACSVSVVKASSLPLESLTPTMFGTDSISLTITLAWIGEVKPARL
jgi:hypothetical protein